MTRGTPLAITAVVAVHNEEAFVRPCLASLAAVADEILVAHDGPCRDRSVEIAREFTPHVWVHEWRGAPETHLIRLLRRASHDWIVRLDCDETLSPGLRAALRSIKASGGDPDVTHYKAIWRAVYDGRDESPARPSEAPDRTVLFRRSCTRWVGIAHAIATMSGPHAALRECIYHYAPHQQYGFVDLLARKLRPFSKADAAIRVRYPIEAIGYDRWSLDEVLRTVDRWRAERPLVSAAPLAAVAGLRTLPLVFRAASPREFARNLRWPAANALYQLMLAWEIHQLRHQGFAPQLASDPTLGAARPAAAR
jgi:glycosyltransferase involved in cell wall biosynthesis